MEKTRTLVTLNAWGGRRIGPLLDFFSAKAGEVDVFCLQEMFDADQAAIDARHPEMGLCADVFRRVGYVLPGHQGAFARFGDDGDRMSLAMFVRRGLLSGPGISDTVVHRPERPQETGNVVRSARKLQHARILAGERAVTVANFHGLWVHGPKTDTPERLVQAARVRSYLAGLAGPKILCGDFNLLPTTESLAIMADGMCDLVKRHGVASTRTPLYRHYHDPAEPNFADYVLVSPEIRVNRFEVLPDQVSDHAPLLLEFS
jgi:endonuclease/exonuclease/phosphatase (EEP) superfamily protein YafD